ncbi:MAG: LytTR family transcriptional regulator [Chitinophagaceae bacterium]|nr:LytTR family transcriptional regulator [Chitinophagaceae bacterium]MBP6589193.1 LytTR family transcriptional regulator [Chitinophagaceae bacterium]
MENSFSPYRDFWLRLGVSLLLSFFFVFLGTDSFSDIINGKYFLSDVLAGFSISFIVTSLINLITSYLDQQYPWHKYFTTRLIYQLIAAVVLPALFVLGFMYTYLIVLLGFKKEEVQFFFTEFPISILFIIFWNVVYVGYYFYRESKKQKEELISLKQQLFTLQNIRTGADVLPAAPNDPGFEAEEAELIPQNQGQGKIRLLVAVSGNKNIPIPVENIACFYKTGNYTTLKTFQSDTYLLNHSLDELAKLLEESLFFRANRQYIINIKACHYFTNEENGKLALHLHPPQEEEVIISQKRAAAFKEWLNP